MKPNHDIGYEYQELMRQVEATRAYRRAFVITRAVAIVLALASAGLWWRMHTSGEQGARSMDMSSASAPSSANEQSAGGTQAPEEAPAPLNPIQLSPQRMQS